ncbi:MAG: ABC transporter permease [Erysipelotrichaceae bacterium]
MNALFYSIMLQWKLDLRDKGVVLTYYVIPLVFFLFMGSIFTSINPESYQTLIPSMSIFAISMGAFLGTPQIIVTFFHSPMKKAYQIGKIPLWSVVVQTIVSAWVHLIITSVLVVLLAHQLYQATLPQSWLAYFGVLSVFLLTSICIGVLLGLLVSNISALTLLSQALFLPSILLSGTMFPTSMLPTVLQNVANMVPATLGYDLLVTPRWSVELFALIAMCVVALLGISYKLHAVQTKE